MVLEWPPRGSGNGCVHTGPLPGPGSICHLPSSPGKKQTQQRSVHEESEGTLRWFQTTDPEGTEFVAHGPQPSPDTRSTHHVSKQLNPHTARRLPGFGGIPGALASVSATEKNHIWGLGRRSSVNTLLVRPEAFGRKVQMKSILF